MTRLASRLRKRVQFRIAVQTPNTTSGGYDRSYTTLATVWAGFKPLVKGRYIRGEQIINDATHEFEVRRSAVTTLGKSFSKGFSSGFDSVTDLNIIKSDFFMFVQSSSTVKGRLFRIRSIEDVKERREFFKIDATEIEEQGTGYPS
jgi:head-tail adaptor